VSDFLETAMGVSSILRFEFIRHPTSGHSECQTTALIGRLRNSLIL